MYPLNGVLRITQLKYVSLAYTNFRYCTKDFLVELYDISIFFHVWGGLSKCLSIQIKGTEVFVYGNETRYHQVVGLNEVVDL